MDLQYDYNMIDNYETEAQLPRAESMANIPRILEPPLSNEGLVPMQSGTEQSSPEETMPPTNYNAEDIPNKEIMMHGQDAEELLHNSENIAAPHTICNKLNKAVSTDPLSNIGEQTAVDKSIAITRTTTEQKLSQQVEYERTASTRAITAQLSEGTSIAPSRDTKEQSFNEQREIIMQDTLEPLYDQESVAFRRDTEWASKEQTNTQQSRTNKNRIQEFAPPATQSDDEFQGIPASETVSRYFTRNTANTLSGENRSHSDPAAFLTTVEKEPTPIMNSSLAKRKFSEVIDLTGDDSDVKIMDGYGNGNGVGQTLARRKRVHYGGHPTSRNQIPNRISTSNSHNLIPPHPLFHQRTEQHIAPNPFNYRPNNSYELFVFTKNISERPDIVQPLDHAKARIREEYNP
jgi:hypothetical protein